MTIMNTGQADTLRRQLQAGGTVLVEYGAPWCAPCRSLLPVLEELDEEYGGNITILKVDCDELPELAAEAGVMGLPTVIVYNGGQPMEKLVGLRPKSAYQGVLDRFTAANTNRR